MLKYKYIFQMKYMEASLSNSTQKLLWFEISKMLIAVFKKKVIVSFIIIFGILSFPIRGDRRGRGRSLIFTTSSLMSYMYNQLDIQRTALRTMQATASSLQ